MACNSCSKSFSLLRKEKGCPSCGFSYCSNCLKHKLFVPKLNCEAKVCMKCESKSRMDEKSNVHPPDAYFKRIKSMHDDAQVGTSTTNAGSSTDQEISNRLLKLREDANKSKKVATEDIATRLQKIRGEGPSTSDGELQLRLANIRGVPVSTLQSNPLSILPDTRTEQEQVDDLMKQYVDHAKMDAAYQDELQGVIDNIHKRLQKLKNTNSTTGNVEAKLSTINVDSEEEVLKEIIEKAEADSKRERETLEVESQELPFCEICNEDANMRCLGCKYLFCKQCFIEHKDEADGCDKYEPYTPPKDLNI